MAVFKLSALAALVTLGSAHADILTYKHHPKAAEAIANTARCTAMGDDWAQTADPHCIFVLPNGAGAYADTGVGILFNKLRNDTGLRCHVAADFVTEAESSINEEIRIDDGSWAVGKNHVMLAHTWGADFWGITFEKVPAGSHRIAYLISNSQGATTWMWSKYALMQCYEETLGVEQ